MGAAPESDGQPDSGAQASGPRSDDAIYVTGGRTKKMSKSYDNTIPIFADEKTLSLWGHTRQVPAFQA